MPLNYTAALVAIATPNFDRLVVFYTNLFTQDPTAFIPNVYAEFQLLGLTLGIYHPKAHVELRMSNSQLKTQNSKLNSSHSALCPPTSLCLEVANLEAAIAYLTELGYPPPGEILTASHGREIYAYDPDGNRLILHQGYQ